MKIGIIGVGAVGSTLDYGFTRLGHDVVKHDIRMSTKIEDVLSAPMIFVCVPTPSIPDSGGCDVTAVTNVIMALDKLRYDGIIVIKSTVTPGTTDSYKAAMRHLRLVFCPEFIREKSTYSDFVENHDVCIIGAYDPRDASMVAMVHNPFPKQYSFVRPIEAEIAKYLSNAMNAMRIIFANQFFNLCEAMGADYKIVKSAVALRNNVGSHYMDCNKNFRAFGGSCLPKDLKALAALVRERKIDASMFQWLLDENEKIKGRS